MIEFIKKQAWCLVLLLFVTQNSCGLYKSEEQFTKKLTAPSFVSELYGCTSKTLAVSHQEASHISWLGFVESNDYKYFKVTKVKAGSELIVSDGVEKDGVTYTASSNSIIEDISIGATGSGNNAYENGSITVAGSTDLQLTIEYCPLQPIDSSTAPHTAYLVANYTAPNTGSLMIAINGYTQGVKDEKCTQDMSTMEAIEYKLVGDAFDLYFCSKQVAKFDQNNTTQDSSDPDYHGASTNLASIPVESPTLTFYKVDSETVCLLTEPTPSIPDIVIPIPDGLAPIASMDVSLEVGSYAECSLDSDNNIYCPQNLKLDALVTLSGFTLTNQAFTAAELETSDCSDFGAISGSGSFEGTDLSLIFSGTIQSDQNSEEYQIVDALIVGVFDLELQ